MKPVHLLAAFLLIAGIAWAVWLLIGRSERDRRSGARPHAAQGDGERGDTDADATPRQPFVAPPPQPEDFADPAESRAARQRLWMVDEQLRGRDITDENVRRAMARVPRHRFVPERYREWAYFDEPLPIGHGQTISQPYVVALMTELVRPGPHDRALDVGTGSGYQAAVLAELVRQVYSIEIVRPLADEARARLEALGYENVQVRHGDGYAGWPEKAPFEVIIVAAAAPRVPPPLIEQLSPGGRLVMPVGGLFQHQRLTVIEKSSDGSVRKRTIAPVAFVPLTRDPRLKIDTD